jgi:hypothetical protein
MKLIRWISAVCLLACSFGALAQSQDASKQNALNQFDAKGKRNGLWWLSQPERMGEPAYTEFGTYYHGAKIGAWYKMDGEGNVTAIENFKDNELNGEAKYFEQGHLYCTGNYRGLNPQYAYDTVVVVDPVSGLESLRAVPSEKGHVRHGIWRFYDPQTGRLIREEEYQVDDLIYRKEFGLTKADSLYYQQRVQALPHNQNVKYEPPANRKHFYTNYKGY